MTVREDPELSAGYPEGIPNRITVTMTMPTMESTSEAIPLMSPACELFMPHSSCSLGSRVA